MICNYNCAPVWVKGKGTWKGYDLLLCKEHQIIHSTRLCKKYYIGVYEGEWFGFSSNEIPSKINFPNYNAVIGPFRTRKAQIWALKYGKNNPHFTCVEDAEIFAKQL